MDTNTCQKSLEDEIKTIADGNTLYTITLSFRIDAAGRE
jgi:hypothetical protein